jgi:hypothetical protein
MQSGSPVSPDELPIRRSELTCPGHSLTRSGAKDNIQTAISLVIRVA